MLKNLATSLAMCLLLSAAALAADPWADQVVSYDPGPDGVYYNHPNTVLGEPSRTTVGYEMDWVTTYEESVRITTPAYQDYTSGGQTVLQIGAGGHLVVRFDEAVANEAANPFGVDLIVFTTLGLFSSDWPDNKTIADPIVATGGTVGTIRVSQDGTTWYTVTGLGTSFPTQAFQSDAWDAFKTGATPSDYTRPVDPSLTLDDLAGLTLAEALVLYNGSGGGLGVDLSSLLDGEGNAASLDWIQYVRIDGATSAIDGFADVSAVPEPATLGLLGIGLAAMLRRRRAA